MVLGTWTSAVPASHSHTRVCVCALVWVQQHLTHLGLAGGRAEISVLDIVS